jgi:hypothetical protein
MFRSLLICAVVSASALGCAGTQPRPDAQTASAALTTPCVPIQTASRIPAKPGACTATPGRSYSQTDIERTGKVNVGDALPLLDPSITIHH